MAKIDFDDFSVKFDLTEQVKDAVFISNEINDL